MKSPLTSFIACLIFLSACSCESKGLAGDWHGSLELMGKRRFVLVVEESAKGTFNAHYDSIETGEFGQAFKNIAVSDRGFHGEFGADGAVDLGMEGPDLLKGTMKMPSDYLASIAGKTFPMELTRGLDFSLPRVDSRGKGVTNYTYRVPADLKDGWEIGDLKKAGGDPKKIEEAVKAILDGSYSPFHSLLLVRHGKLLLDEYFYGYGPGDEHQLQSTTKSVLSILFGIAEGQGLVNQDQKLFDYFPTYRDQPGWDKRKDKITLGNLLTMTSGFACDGRYRKALGDGCVIDMINSPDWVDYCLTQPMAHEPGRHFSYCTSCLTLLGAVLSKQSGMSVADFAQKNLYDPLGIQGGQWLTGPHGITEVGASHWLRPQDMAKLGLLYLDKGQWKGKQIVPSDWVKESTLSQPLPPDGKPWEGFTGYGYLWWSQKMHSDHGDIFAYYSNGKGGQYIIVVPDLDLVCVMTAGYYFDLGSDRGLELFKAYILDAFS